MKQRDGGAKKSKTKKKLIRLNSWALGSFSSNPFIQPASQPGAPQSPHFFLKKKQAKIDYALSSQLALVSPKRQSLMQIIIQHDGLIEIGEKHRHGDILRRCHRNRHRWHRHRDGNSYRNGYRYSLRDCRGTRTSSYRNGCRKFLRDRRRARTSVCDEGLRGEGDERGLEIRPCDGHGLCDRLLYQSLGYRPGSRDEHYGWGPYGLYYGDGLSERFGHERRRGELLLNVARGRGHPRGQEDRLIYGSGFSEDLGGQLVFEHGFCDGCGLEAGLSGDYDRSRRQGDVYR